MKKLLLCSLFVLCLPLIALAQVGSDQVTLSYYLPDNHTYDPAIPTPESVVGHEVGQWHITHDKLVKYLEVLASVSDRFHLENRGTTFEGRPLLLVTVTSPENHKRIDAIAAERKQLIRG